MHVTQISFYLDPAGRRPRELLRAWHSLGDIADCAAASVARVSVIQACAYREDFVEGGVEYHFVPPDNPRTSLARGRAFAALLAALDPDLLHLHGLGLPRDILALRALAPGLPLMLQDHANRPPRAWHRPAWRRALAAADGIAFCSAPQAEPFAQAGLLQPHTEIFAVPESTSRFTPGDIAEARRATGVHGDPCLLWVGHLDRNKDPLAVLDGVSRASTYLSELQLWCCFGAAPLLSAVEQRVRSDPRLAGRVHLLGSRPHADIEQLMRAADLFVLGSHREGSGYALIEALATGLAPVVTDIPSFRALTGNGRIGELWPCGDAERLCQALCSAAARPRVATRRTVRMHFESDLSLAAVGRRWGAAYDRLLARRHATARELAG